MWWVRENICHVRDRSDGGGVVDGKIYANKIYIGYVVDRAAAVVVGGVNIRLK